MKLKMHRPAVVMNRIGASIIDMFLISILYGVIVAIATGRYSAMWKRFNISLGDYRYDFALVFLLMAFYFIVVPLVWNGCTVGKKITRTRLISLTNETVTFKILTLRFFVLLIPNVLLLGMPSLCNVYMMLFRKDNSGFHDLVMKTRVISVI
ncbi:hypothetical protein BAMA_09450 [Bacillus manliponensis]|uniref:RDD domain-containing protein n=1 Tax=Bacillus manliponensis TaxID=574376 RepID=A0A073KFD7_9BACI|nr:RDD family protein [Bacillus manliponensis]KEK21008.1 hypothetical protein BAMA_09450 [Bacillus manliponensis]